MNRLSTYVFASAAIVSLSGCGINSIPTAEEKAKAEWADVQAAYQRRANLIPNLEATVKGSAASEGKILGQVTEARARATQITLSPEQLRDPEAVRAFSQAQGQLSTALIPLRQLQEAYPNLQSQGNFKTLMTQLEGSENRINIEILDYNKAVQDYNTRIRTFPDVIGAKVFYGSEPMVQFQATTPNAEQAPTVDFGNSQ